jgi:hypothetical protein
MVEDMLRGIIQTCFRPIDQALSIKSAYFLHILANHPHPLRDVWRGAAEQESRM